MESQIMEEATRLFADRGFAGTSLQDIADATGLTRPALYQYFGSKEELLSRLVSELTEGPADELGEIRRRTGTTATERLRARNDHSSDTAMAATPSSIRDRMAVRASSSFRSTTMVPSRSSRSVTSHARRLGMSPWDLP
jgi:AcrR family transcriptional regulator